MNLKTGARETGREKERDVYIPVMKQTTSCTSVGMTIYVSMY